jgi:phage gpG-like protein
MAKRAFKKDLLTRLKVEIGNEWQANFDRRSFFSKSWAARRLKDRSGQLLDVTGKLRGSIRGEVTPEGVRWWSSVPYAEIMNSGGEIVITEKMKRFFWAKYYEASGKVKYYARANKKTGAQKGDITRGTQKEAEAAVFYKALALKKVGDKIVIPERRFIGDSPEVATIFRNVSDKTMKEVEQYLSTILNRF